jgi:hypothetical protein
MRLTFLCIILFAMSAPAEAGTINRVIGDLSFVATHGRPPTAADSARLRIQTHLAFVETLLRAREVGSLSAQARRARAHLLDELRRYWQAGSFPVADTREGYLPVFIDHRGVRCAVGHLIERTIPHAPAVDPRPIDREYHHAYIDEISGASFEAWVAASGFTRAELAMIQPTYPPQPPDLNLKVVADYRQAVDSDERTEDPGRLISLQTRFDTTLLHNYYIGTPNLAIDAGLGWAEGARVMYNAHARFGTSVTMYLGDCRDGCRGQRLGWLAGIGVDAVGDRIPRAWTVPIDVLYFVKPSGDTQVGLVGGPRFGLSADRGIGWAASLQLVWREAFDGDERKPYLPRDVNLELGVTSIADVMLVGISLGIRIRARAGYHAEAW